MSTFGDFFPEPEKQRFINDNLAPGKVLYLFSEFVEPPKEKFLLLSCMEPEPLVFVINSQINPFIKRDQHLFDCQVQLNASNYTFLDHDSYINCSQILSIGMNIIIDQVSSDLGRIKGEINMQTKQSVIQSVNRCRTISLAHKKLILPGFGGVVGS